MTLPAAAFRKRYLYLILAAWMLPPVVGLGFIVFIQVLSLEQVLAILLTPVEPAYILFWQFFSVWYFMRYIRPVGEWLESGSREAAERAAYCMRRFPLHFWFVFLFYLTLAPASVILSAELYTDYVARPVDWFRIHLVALIVSIIVGLPIFFMILDLFGRVSGGLRLRRPHVSIRLKIFLIGALTPLLIDTMLVQYYWTRTGFFTLETFLVWLLLELLAVAGSLIFVHSFSQSVAPLHRMIEGKVDIDEMRPEDLVPMSTDEMGVLSNGYRHLLAALQESRSVLESRVEERTAELRASNEELASFNYSVSHDLRSPLRAIDGYSQALLEDYHARLDAEGRQYLSRIRHNAQRMAQLIDDLLDLSRIGRADIRLRPIDLGLLADEIMTSLLEAWPERDIRFENRVDQIVQGDRTLLSVLLANLLGNAVKYTSRCERTHIVFECTRREGEDVFCVGDNGAGFDMNYADKLFRPFHRLHPMGEYEGTGIGLAIVARVVQRHGGWIRPEAAPGQGARFYFTLPGVPGSGSPE